MKNVSSQKIHIKKLKFVHQCNKKRKWRFDQILMSMKHEKHKKFENKTWTTNFMWSSSDRTA